jgi:hypothetical protein
MIISDKHKIIYYSVPKIAHSSLMDVMHIVRTGKKFDYENHKIYRTYHTKNFNKVKLTSEQKNYYKFCVVRDPVDRFVSAFVNRILVEKRHYKNNSDHKQDFILWKKKKFREYPTIYQFLKNYENYNENMDLNFHFRPLTSYLGNDPSFFDDVYDISELKSKLIPKLQSITNTKLVLPHKMKGKKIITVKDLNEEAISQIKLLYRQDYTNYGKYFKYANK